MIEGKEIFDTLLGIVVAIIGFFAKHVHAKAEKTEADLAAFKTHVAENYTSNSRIDKIENSIDHANKRLDSIYEILTKDRRK